MWKLANSPSTRFFCKNSVKLTFSSKSYTVNQFDEKRAVRFVFLKLHVHTENHGLMSFSGATENPLYSVAPEKSFKKTKRTTLFPWNQLFSNFFGKNVNLTEKMSIFFVKTVIAFLTNFPHCELECKSFSRNNLLEWIFFECDRIIFA